MIGFYPGRVDLEFSGEIRFRRGPAPCHFVTVPDEQCGALEAASGAGHLRLRHDPSRRADLGIGWTTSLWPKDGRRYIVPVKARVRQAEGLDVGDTVTVRLTLDV